MPCAAVDGMDPAVVYSALQEAIDRARSGGGPTFLEIRTYRYKGHSMSDAQHYRTKDEVAEYQKVDPITIVKKMIEKKKWLDTKGFEKIDSKVKSLVADCVKFGEDSPFPQAHELWQDIYVQNDYPFIKE
jgi:pyruvate dehydrogenase E1 component alpha subunit